MSSGSTWGPSRDYGSRQGDAYGSRTAACCLCACRLRRGVVWKTSADEGIELRQLGVSQPILLLTGFWEGEQAALTNYDLTPAVYSGSQLTALESWASHTGKKIRFHLKVNTGMGAWAFTGRPWMHSSTLLSRMPHLELEGVFSQFASAEDFTSKSTELQAEHFGAVQEQLRRAGIERAICIRPTAPPWSAVPKLGTIWCDRVCCYMATSSRPRGRRVSRDRSSARCRCATY